MKCTNNNCNKEIITESVKDNILLEKMNYFCVCEECANKIKMLNE